MRVTVISPERSLFEGEAEAVRAPAFDGQVGILPRHAPFMTLLGSGILTVTGKRGGERDGEGGGARFRVAGGFMQVVGDSVRIVAGSAEPA